MAEAAPAQDRPLRELRGVVERITFQNAESGFTVARLAPERPESEAEAARGDDRLVTVVGSLADLTPGEAIVAPGWGRNDASRGECRPRLGWGRRQARLAVPGCRLSDGAPSHAPGHEHVPRARPGQ